MQNKMKQAPVTTVIIAANIIVFLVLSMFGMTEDTSYMMTKGAMYVPNMMANHQYYPLITCIFLHFGIQHLLNNMLVLGWSGYTLEWAVGSVRMLLIYFGSGIAGNLLSMYMELQKGDFAVGAGASGAIFGVMGALLYVAIRNHGSVYGLSQRSLGLMLLLSIYMGFTSEGVDNAAHIGGAVGGFILAVLLASRIRRKKNRL